MEYKLDKDILLINVIDKIDSANAMLVEKEFDQIIKSNNFDLLILDFSNTNFISSAGLRILIKLKKTVNKLEIINVNLEVYDILEMTGLTELLTVKRQLKEIDISNAKLIGEGYFSLVYRIDRDTIIKVFKRNTDLLGIQRELDLAKQAFIKGIPTAISFDIVKVKDKYGVRFEMLDCKSLRDVLKENNFDIKYIKLYAKLLETINSTPTNGFNLPNCKEVWINKLNYIKDYISDKTYQRSLELIKTIKDEDYFIHGDCHFKNIMVNSEDELLLIDMDTLSKGNKIFELATLYCPYYAFEEDDPGNALRFFEMDIEKTHYLYDNLLKFYLGENYNELNDKIKVVAYIHMLYWNKINEPENSKRFNGCLERLEKLIYKINNLNI